MCNIQSVLARALTATGIYVSSLATGSRAQLLHSSVGFQRVKIAAGNRKSTLSDEQIRESLSAESGDESDGNDDSNFDEFILSEMENSPTSDEDTSPDASTSSLGKLIYHSKKKCTLTQIESM